MVNDFEHGECGIDIEDIMCDPRQYAEDNFIQYDDDMSVGDVWNAKRDQCARNSYVKTELAKVEKLEVGEEVEFDCFENHESITIKRDEEGELLIVDKHGDNKPLKDAHDLSDTEDNAEVFEELSYL